MKKKVFLILGFIILVALSAYWVSVYRSLKNPFDEMIYSETQSTKVTLFTPLSTVVGSDRHFKASDDFISLDYDENLLNNDESMYTFISPSILSFTYSVNIEEDVKVVVAYSYRAKNATLTQSVHLSDQKKTYHGDDLLTQLSAYGKDLDWLQTTSQTVLEDDILGLWFKKGSHRYFLDNLGDLTITYDDVLSGSN